MKNFIKNLVCFFLNMFSFLAPKDKVVILMYHSIGRNNVFSTVSPENFERQMNFLKKGNYNVMGFSKLAALLEQKKEIPNKTVVLTFDDGYSDNFIFAWPVLKRCNFPATIFLTTGLMGGVKIKKTGEQMRMLDWLQIDKMFKSGLIDFQPHTISHPRLTEITPEEATGEILNSQKAVDEQLANQPRFFAYPYGDYNQTIIDILKNSGFRAAVTVKKGIVRNNSPLLELRRKSINQKTNIGQFKAKINFGLL